MTAKTLSLKSTSLAIGAGTPAPISKYSTDHGKAYGTMPEVAPTPRDGGGMSTGETGGNFSMAGMTGVGLNAGATGTKDVADSASDELTNAAKTL